MAVKTYTYDELMEKYAKLLPEDVDTREGTLAHMVMSMTAMSVAQLYEELKIIEENAYGSTAMEEYLDYTVELLGLERIEKSRAVVKIVADEGFVVGQCFVGGDLTYRIKSVHDGYYLAECTTAGSVGNSYLGEVLPESSSVFGNGKITEIIAPGMDKEDDETLRKRYFERIYCPICTGNVSYYKEVLNSVPGVGGIKVYPVFDGAGTVKVVITDEDYAPAGEELLSYVKEYLDPEETSGLGYGVVPIGHSVTVDTVEKVDIDIQLEVTGDASQNNYLRTARSYLPPVLHELNKKWDRESNIVIWNRIIEDYFFSLDGVKDVNVISINNVASRLILGENQIIGEITLNGI